MNCFPFNINTEVVFLRLVPHFWLFTPESDDPKEIFVEYLKNIASSFYTYQQNLNNLCVEKKEFLNVSGQHLSLENKLNNDFDDTLRRIYITEGNIGTANKIWYLLTETDPEYKVWYTFGEINPANETWFKEGEASNLSHFTVHIPIALTGYETEVISMLSNYVINAYNYNIVYF